MWSLCPKLYLLFVLFYFYQSFHSGLWTWHKASSGCDLHDRGFALRGSGEMLGGTWGNANLVAK